MTIEAAPSASAERALTGVQPPVEDQVRPGPPPGLVERAFAVLALILYSNGFFTLVFDIDETVETPELRFVWLPIYLLTVVAVVPRFAQVRQVMLANKITLLLGLLCCLSAWWSIDPGVTFRRGIAVCATILFGLYLIARYDDLDRLRLLGWAFGIVALSSVVVALAMPTYGVSQELHAGAWRGVYPQKNMFGQFMVYACAVFLVLGLADPAIRRRALALCALCAALVLLARSATAGIALLMMLGLAFTITVLFRHRVLAVIGVYGLIFGTVGLTLALLTDPDAVFGLIGRDATLTGRTDIWVPLWDMMRQRFWLGYGYGVFWDDPEGPAWYIRRYLQWDVPSAHNGWAETWLNLGVVGVALFGLSFALAAFRATVRLRLGRRPAAEMGTSLWPCLFLSLFLVFSFSESSILRHNDLIWIMYVATIGAFGFRRVEPRPETVTYYGGMASAGPAEADAAPAGSVQAGTGQQWSYWR